MAKGKGRATEGANTQKELPGARGLFMQMLETVSARMAVVEMRKNGSPAWEIIHVVTDPAELDAGSLDGECRDFASLFGLNAGFRWRYGTLSLEPGDKCMVFTKLK